MINFNQNLKINFFIITNLIMKFIKLIIYYISNKSNEKIVKFIRRISLLLIHSVSSFFILSFYFSSLSYCTHAATITKKNYNFKRKRFQITVIHKYLIIKSN